MDARLAQGVQIVLPGGAGVQHNHFAGRRPARWPHQVGVLPLRADGFQHRTVADTLVDQVRLGTTAVVTQVLSGLGGVGKTQLAADFARQLWTGGELDLLLWISATSREAVLTGYARAAADLALGPDAEDLLSAATRFLAWLSSTDRRWLVVLDDLGTATAVRDLWPPNWTSGRTVVTTRRRDATLLAGRQLVEVGVFTHQEAVEFLTRKLPSRLTDDITGVVDDLGRLPLALGQAAAYMIDQDLTCSRYRERFAQRHRRLAELVPDEDGLFDGGTPVATTWALSIEAADKSPPRGLARPLLTVAAMLDSNGIPESLFTASATRLAAGTTASTFDDIRSGLRCLHRFNLATCDADRVSVHALVQRAVRDDLSPTSAMTAARTAADALDEIWRDTDDPDVSQAQLLRANALAVHTHESSALLERGVHPVLLRLADSFGDAALLDRAIGFTRSLLVEAADRLDPDHPDAFALRGNLAWWLGDTGRLDEALAALNDLVADTTRALGPDDLHTLDARQGLGYQHGQAGHPRQAARILSKVYCDRVRVSGADAELTLVTGDQLGYWLTEAGEIDAAVTLLEELCPRAERALGPHRRTTLSLRSTLASAWGSAGDPARAADTLCDVIEALTQTLGADHREVWVARSNEAYWRWQAGDLERAAVAMELVLGDRIRMFGMHHRDTLAARDNVAVLHGLLGDRDTALAELTEVQFDRSQVLGYNHPDTMNTRYGVALLRAQLGDIVAAVAELDAVLAEQERVLGPGHPATERTRTVLATWRPGDDSAAPASGPPT